MTVISTFLQALSFAHGDPAGGASLDQVAIATGIAVALFAAIVESSDAAIISKDLDGTILTWNPAGEQILGYPVAGPNDDLRRGRRRYNLVWYRPAEEWTELKDLLNVKE